MKLEIITTKGVLYDKCENMEELYDDYYFPLLVEFKELQKQNTELKDNRNKLKEWLEETEKYFADVYKKYDKNDLVYRYYKGAKNATGDALLKLQEIEKGGMNE